MQTENKKHTQLVMIAREFGIPVKDMKAEAEKLSERDRQELSSAIASQNGIPADECDWETVAKTIGTVAPPLHPGGAEMPFGVERAEVQSEGSMTEHWFYRASGKFGFLSNLFRLEVPLRLPDEFDESGNLVRKAAIFSTSEAAYQYGKPRKQEVADWIVSAPAPHLCAAAAHALFVFDVRHNWSQIKVARMRWVLRLKFDRTQRYPLWQSLMDTGDAVLIEASSMDAFFGIGKKGNGKNMLGKLLMEVRDEMRQDDK